MFLTIPGAIALNNGVAETYEMEDVTIRNERGVIWISYESDTVVVALSLDELRAIMRLFDPARASTAQDDE